MERYTLEYINSLPTLQEAINKNMNKYNTKILLKCEECGNEYVLTFCSIKDRKVESNKSICNHCLFKKGYRVNTNMTP